MRAGDGADWHCTVFVRFYYAYSKLLFIVVTSSATWRMEDTVVYGGAWRMYAYSEDSFGNIA